jgi:hypothetical protein
MQAGPELSDGLKERQIACIEGTMGFHVARMIHIYLYEADRLWDTDRILRSFRASSSNGEQAIDIYLVLCAYIYMPVHDHRDVEP